MARDVASMLEKAREEVPEISVEALIEETRSGGVDLVLDVRGAEEVAGGAIPGSLHVPRGLLEFHADPNSSAADEALTGQREARIVVVCASGGRSLLAGQLLIDMGYDNVVSLAGGVQAWQEAGAPVEPPA